MIAESAHAGQHARGVEGQDRGGANRFAFGLEADFGAREDAAGVDVDGAAFG